MTSTYVLTNHKVGVAKSTSAMNIAYRLLFVFEQAGINDAFLTELDTIEHEWLNASGVPYRLGNVLETINPFHHGTFVL